MPSIIKVVNVDITSIQALVGCSYVKPRQTMPAMVAIHLLYCV